MKKLWSFFVFKLSTDRLKKSNYRTDISLEQARANGEIVRLGNSELQEAIRRIRKQEFIPEKLEKLLEERKKLYRKQNTPENRERMREISTCVDEILFQKDIVILSIKDVRHYSRVIKNGLYVNGVEYKRLLCSAGHARRSTTIWANAEIWNQLDEILNCGRNPQTEINPNKFSSYHGMASSATLRVSSPRFVVVPDCEVEKTMIVDWFVPQENGIDPIFEEREIKQKVSLFDGQGLISPAQAMVWQSDLELDYTPSAFIFRGPFLKGLLVVFDFPKFAYEKGIKKITDIYGVEHYIDDIEVILTLSQFKMASGYKDLTDFIVASKKYDFSWGVSRVSPKQDKDSTTSTYQYIQAMDIAPEKIKDICEPTVKWLQSISGDDWASALIFLLGDLGTFTSEDFRTADFTAKAIMLEPNCLNDSYICKRLLSMQARKIKDSYIGVLKLLGSYQFVIADPYGECQHALGLPVTGLINKGFAYSQYWNKKNIDKISAYRSPMTWRSEHLVLNLDKIDSDWYQYLYSGIVFNIFDDWLMRMSGGDVDGDIIMTTPSFTDCHYEGYNVPVYERKNAGKSIINNDELWKSDTLSFGSRIGLITNFSTTFYSLLPIFPNEPECTTLINRLKTATVEQSMQIDKTKGIEIYDIPTYWDKWQKEGDNAELYNSLLARQRPYFMRYVYGSWNKRYKRHCAAYNNLCVVRLGYSLNVLLEKQTLNEQEKKIKDEFYQRSPLIDSPCTVNLICHYLEKEVKEIKYKARNRTFDYSIYMNPDIEIDENKLHKMELLYEKYRAHQRSFHDKPLEDGGEDDESTLPTRDEYIITLEREAYGISNNLEELANLMVEVCYGSHKENSKEFCWKMFNGKALIDVLIKHSRGFAQVPILDELGTYHYLGRNYTLTNINVLETEGESL